MKTTVIEGHTFLPSHIGKDDVVLDLGANLGRFSLGVIARFGCRCIAVEPSPEVFSSIPDCDRLTKVNCAISDKDALVSFRLSANSEASGVVLTGATEVGDVITVEGLTIESLCASLNVSRVALMKIDIEGLEIPVLDACSDEFLRSVRQLTVEFHDFCQLTEPAEVTRVSDRLKRLGFFEIRMTRESYLDTLFVNRRDPGMTWLAFLYIRYVERNWLGLNRALRRALGAGS